MKVSNVSDIFAWKHQIKDAPLNIVGRIYWHGDFVVVEETCLVCKNECSTSWELSFRWGNDKTNKIEYISEVCWSCYEKLWSFCDNTKDKPFSEWCEQSLK